LLPALPGNLPVPVVIVQHMPPLFTKLLADRLQASCALRVEEGKPGTVVRAGSVYIAPGNFHMLVRDEGGTLRLNVNQAAPENSCRPAVDVLFKSVAETFGARALGVVLTGMGKDGLRGSQLIVDAGGSVVVQDQQSSVVWGMPGFVANAGIAERVLPLNQIAPELLRRVRQLRPEFRSSVSAVSPHLVYNG
jgi:two-component system chemotaxis response regulator CheB